MNTFTMPTIISTLTTSARTLWSQFDTNKGLDANKLSVSTILLLDPLTTVIRLGMLKFKPECTKIGVADNKLTFYEPNLYQGMARRWAGDSRTDLQYLHLPLLYFACIKHGYVESSLDKSPNKEKIIKRLNDMAIDGLKALRNIYNQQNHKIDMVTNCIDSYIHLLTVDADNSTFIKDKYSNVQNTIKLTYAEFTKEWSESNIKIILDLVNELHKKKSTVYSQGVITTIESMLNTMDELIDKIRS